MSIFQSYAMILKEKNSYRLWAIDIQERGVALIFSLRNEKKINSFGFPLSQNGIKYFPHLYIKGCRRVSFSSLLPFQVNKKKNKYKFIQCSMVVFVLCSVSHIYIFQVIFMRYGKRRMRLLAWRRVFFAFLSFLFLLFIFAV